MHLGNIRVKVNKKYHSVYRALTQDSATRPRVFWQHSDLFVFCAVLGFREGRSNPVKSDGFFWSNALNGYQQTTLTTLAVASQNDYSLLTHPETIVRIAEEYADVGIQMLLSTLLSDYQQQDSEGAYTLNYADAHQLEKAVLSYIQGEMNQDPFS